MRTNRVFWVAVAVLVLLTVGTACSTSPTPVPPTPVPTAIPPTLPPAPTPAPPTAAPTVAPTTAPTAAPTQPPTVAATTAATSAPTTSSSAGSGIPAADVEKLINDKFNKVDRNLALWNIQPGLGTVMIEYGNRFSRLWFAANAGNWDMAKYQLDEMTEIQEVGETTRPARQAPLKAFEDKYLAALDKAIGAKDKAAFTTAFNEAANGCNACHAGSSGGDWKSYSYVKIQVPKTDPAAYLDWKGGGQDSHIANPAPAATTAPKATLAGTLDAAGVEKLVNSKFNTVDRNLALWNIQPGLGTVMIEYGNRFGRLYYAAKANNWDMAKYQLDEMVEIQEVGETTRPSRAAMLQGFEKGALDPLDEAITAKDSKAFDTAFAKAVDGCNGCHAASSGADWKSYQYVKVQVPTADNNDYLVWKADKSIGNYIANPPAAATATPKPALSGALDAKGVAALVDAKFNNVDTSLALWNIQPGLGTIMIEYGRRFSQLRYALNAGNWDMAKYQLDEMTEIQEVGETTRPGRAAMLKAFEDGFLKPMDSAILAKDKPKADSAFAAMVGGCNGCHAASKGTNWSSYAYVQVQPPQSDPADYVSWNAGAGNTGNYAPATSGTPAPGATTAPSAGGPPKIPASHVGRTQCLVCHKTGAGGAPTPVPSIHASFADDPTICKGCHQQGQ